VLHDAGGDVTHGQECAACLGRFAGREEQGALVLRAEFLFQEGGELRGAANTTKVPDRGPTCEGPCAMGAISVGGFSRRRTLVALAGDA
jgi:hypothetical protein